MLSSDNTRDIATAALTEVFQDEGFDEEKSCILAAKAVATLGQENLLPQQVQRVAATEQGIVSFPVETATHGLPVCRLMPLNDGEEFV